MLLLCPFLCVLAESLQQVSDRCAFPNHGFQLRDRCVQFIFFHDPSARVLAMLSSAEPTSFMRLEITWNSFSEVCCGSGILKATLPACDSRISRGSKFFKSTQIFGSSSAGMGRSPLSQYIKER